MKRRTKWARRDGDRRRPKKELTGEGGEKGLYPAKAGRGKERPLEVFRPGNTRKKKMKKKRQTKQKTRKKITRQATRKGKDTCLNCCVYGVDKFCVLGQQKKRDTYPPCRRAESHYIRDAKSTARLINNSYDAGSSVLSSDHFLFGVEKMPYNPLQAPGRNTPKKQKKKQKKKRILSCCSAAHHNIMTS